MAALAGLLRRRRWRGGPVGALGVGGAWRGLSAGARPGGASGGWYEALAASAPVAWAEAGLAGLQASSGLPWWASVVATSALLRTGLTLPLAAQQSRVLAKLDNLQPEIGILARRLGQEVSHCAQHRGWTPRLARRFVLSYGEHLQWQVAAVVTLTFLAEISLTLFHLFHFKKNLKRIISELYVRDNCHPFKASLLIWIQIPVWVFVSVALRNFSIGRAAAEGFSIQEQLSTGGTLWFMDLTVPDSTWILPICLGLLNLLIVEVFVIQRTKLSRFQKYTTHFFRGMAVLMVPVAATVPSAVALYWVSSSFMGLSHNLLLRSPAFRRLCRIPRTKSDSDTPYRDIIAAFCAKYFLK